MAEALITFDEAEQLAVGQRSRQKRRTVWLAIVGAMLAVAISLVLVVMVAQSDSRVGLETLFPWLETDSVRPLEF